MKGREKNNKENKSGLRKSILRATLIPTITFGILIIIYCSNQMARSIHQEVESSLKNIAQSAMYMYEMEYPGEYRIDKATGLVYKGDRRVESASGILEKYKEISGSDITIFYKDARLVTTIRDKDGQPIIGTKARSVIIEDVMQGKKEHFYTQTTINDEWYFSYYSPLFDDKGECIGMVFAGKPSGYVRNIVLREIFPVVAVIIVSVLVIVIIICYYANHLACSIQQIQKFVSKVEQGNFEAELGNTILSRKDELGQLGKAATKMKASLRELVEKDALTRLYNRHYGEIWLKKVKQESQETGVPFFVAIGDIDFFKKFNDNYGHDCGDMVLRKVAEVLSDGMRRKGYVSRWGGEEFLMVFHEGDIASAVGIMTEIAEKIRSTKLKYNDEILGITMTIGVVEGERNKNVDDLIKKADQALYEGKEAGRDRVIFK